MNVVTDDGTRLAFDDTGEGAAPALLLVHGWCSDARAWDAMVDHLGNGTRVLAVDRRGHGRSEAPPSGYDIDTHAADLLAVLEATDVDTVVVVAHAGGAPGAMEFTRRHPARVAALVLVDTMLRDGPLRSAEGGPSPLEALADRVGSDDEAFATMYRGFFADPDTERARRAIAAASTVPSHVRSAELVGIGVDTIAIGRRIDCPVLWVHVGDLDDRVDTTFADVETIHIADAGHFVQVDAPERVAAALTGFVTRRVTNAQNGSGEPGAG